MGLSCEASALPSPAAASTLPASIAAAALSTAPSLAGTPLSESFGRLLLLVLLVLLLLLLLLLLLPVLLLLPLEALMGTGLGACSGVEKAEAIEADAALARLPRDGMNIRRLRLLEAFLNLKACWSSVSVLSTRSSIFSPLSSTLS